MAPKRKAATAATAVVTAAASSTRAKRAEAKLDAKPKATRGKKQQDAVEETIGKHHQRAYLTDYLYKHRRRARTS
jgi:hypothetical protein